MNTLKDLFKSTSTHGQFDNSDKCIKIPIKDYENLVSRVTLLENKLLIVEVSLIYCLLSCYLTSFEFIAAKSTAVVSFTR
jgi:hypothetical protein